MKGFKRFTLIAICALAGLIPAHAAGSVTVFGEGAYVFDEDDAGDWRAATGLSAGLEAGGATYRARLAVGLDAGAADGWRAEAGWVGVEGRFRFYMGAGVGEADAGDGYDTRYRVGGWWDVGSWAGAVVSVGGGALYENAVEPAGDLRPWISAVWRGR